MAAADHEHAAEGHVLADQAELGDLRVAEVFPELANEGFVDAPEVRGELLGEADGEGVTGFEVRSDSSRWIWAMVSSSSP